MPADEKAQGAAENLCDALSRRDWDALAKCFNEDVVFRALLPSRIREQTGIKRVVREFVDMFGDSTEFDLLESHVSTVVDRTHLAYRFHAFEDGAWHRVEQQTYLGVDDDGKIAFMNLVCSGYRPEPA